MDNHNYTDAEQAQINAGISTIIGLLNAVAVNNAVRLEIVVDVAARIIASAGGAENRRGLLDAVIHNLTHDIEEYAACDCAGCQAQRAEEAAAESSAAKEASNVIAMVSRPRN